MKHLLRTTITTSCLVLIGATAAPAAQVASTGSQGSAAVVTAADLAQSPRSNLYDFVRAERPLWLRTRGISGSGSTEVMVYVDGNRIGGPSELRNISPRIVAEMRYIDRREATTRWGSGHGSGAILISTGPLPTEVERAVHAGTAVG